MPVQQLWESIERMHVQEPIINLVKRMYQNCKAVVKCGKVISSEFVVSKGLRQGCGMSPSLFKIYLETVLSQWNRSCSSMGIEIKNTIIHSLLFADDQVIMAQERDDIKFMTKKVNKLL